jgi:hypothetical protein
LSELRFTSGRVSMQIENRYDFTNLAQGQLRWRAQRLPAAGASAAPTTIATGRAPMPDLAPHARTAWEIPVGVTALGINELLELTALDRGGQELWTWVVRGAAPEAAAATAQSRIERHGNTVKSGAYALEFDRASGMLVKLSARGRSLPLQGPQLVAWQRAPNLRSFIEVAAGAQLRQLELAPVSDDGTLMRASYDGALREVAWKIRGEDLLLSYRIVHEGAVDILGVSFAYPEQSVRAKRWVGEGPYRIWKNRQAGTTFDLHQANYSRSVPGVSYEYPEFEGFFGAWDWLELQTREARVVIRNHSGVPYFALYRPTPGEKPILELPDLGWSFLHALPPIGTKFALPDSLGPQSQTTQVREPIEGEISFRFSSP